MNSVIYSKKPATLSEISDFEREIKNYLPDDYKDFLMKYNGGKPQPDSFRFFSGRADASSVDRFLSLGKEKNSNLLKYYNNYKNRIPLGFIPIAHDAGGNLIIMELKSNGNNIFLGTMSLKLMKGRNRI